MLRIHDILGNGQLLDGGAMFGNAPRDLWGRWYPVDDHNRIRLSCRALLVDTGERRILLETGVGAFFEPKLKERYGVMEERHVLLESLERVGYPHDSIDAVVLSHLHFDHAGGLLSAYEPGKEPELLFPKATFVVGKRAFERAKKPHARDRASFIEALPPLLERSGRLALYDDAPPAVPGLERFEFRETNGHTVGMLHTSLVGEHHRVFFCADLVPGSAWVHLPITMGYDRFPERLIDEKERIFGELERSRSWLFFTHDPNCALAGLGKDARGRYQTRDAVPSLPHGWDLDRPEPPPR